MPLKVLPPLQYPAVDGAPFERDYYEYWQALDMSLRTKTLGPLVNAVNDAAAAAAGVPIDGLYRNGNVVQIRVT